MKTALFNKLLLKTAFSCMACDGEIDNRELNLIRRLHQIKSIFGDIDIDNEINIMLYEINLDCKKFLRAYFFELKSYILSEQEELKIIEVAVKIIKADEKVKYAEVKFFKFIRSKLKINDYLILSKFPDFEEFLEDDIVNESYVSNLLNSYLDSITLPRLKIINNFENF